jgi:2-keto-4-pentenoate hydratase/2-oxohepta-3-ene-1,7-dioic acid hydratase in catechol pathway
MPGASATNFREVNTMTVVLLLVLLISVSLAYSKHIKETASDFDPEARPVVFRKSTKSLKSDE